MFDCRDYGKGCEICGISLCSCEYVMETPDLCDECEKAVKDAREQVLYLRRLNAKSTNNEPV